MSNVLCITVTTFTTHGTNESTVGFTASDDYSMVFENGYESIDQFLEIYPTENDLIERVLSEQCFEDVSYEKDEDGNIVITDDTFSGIMVYGFPED